MIKKSLPVFLSLCCFFNVFAQKAVYQLPVSSEVTISNPAFFYTLPKTAFKVDIVVTKTSHIKGIYADYAEKLLGVTNYCKENSVSFHVKSFMVTPFTVPDEALQFVVEVSAMQMKNNFISTLYEKNATSPFHVSSTLEKAHTDILPDFFKNYADVILQQTYETYTETKIIDGVVTQVPVTQTKITTKSLLQQAQDAADYIEKIRKNRYDILSFSQEVTLTKDALEYLVNQLNELEKKYLELFTGITVLEDIRETVMIYPKNGTALLPLCSVTPNTGFSQSMSPTAAYNYYIQCVPDTPLNLQVNFREANTLAKQKQKNGYRIRKAIPTFVSLVNLEQKEKLGIFPVYQFGLLETLPPDSDDFEIGKWGYIY